MVCVGAVVEELADFVEELVSAVHESGFVLEWRLGGEGVLSEFLGFVDFGHGEYVVGCVGSCCQNTVLLEASWGRGCGVLF